MEVSQFLDMAQVSCVLLFCLQVENGVALIHNPTPTVYDHMTVAYSIGFFYPAIEYVAAISYFVMYFHVVNIPNNSSVGGEQDISLSPCRPES